MATNFPRPSGVKRPPKYSRQKEKGRADRAYVFLDGKKVMLGRYDSLESREKYNELISGSVGNTNTSGSDSIRITSPTVSELLAAYLEHAATYYQKSDGTPGGEFISFRITAGWLRRAAGAELAKDFGPKRLKLLREQMIAAGWSRNTVNDRVQRVRRIFRWAASEEMVDAKAPLALDTVDNLHRGRSKAKETRPVRPVADVDVEATLKHLPQVVADMVKVQRLTGMRPGELTTMRPCDIDRSGVIWLYRPPAHKTAYLGNERTIAIGPKCQEVLLRYLARSADAHCFQPCDSEAKRRAARSAERKTPITYGNSPGTNRKETPQRAAGASYSVDSYRRAIERAAKKAGVEVWTPNRLRHSAATEIRAQFGTGEINLGGGTVEFSQDLTNQADGWIGGRGELRADGGLTNTAVMAFSGGFTDVYGDVTNSPGGQIVVSGGSTTTTFYDDVDTEGELRVSAASSAVFFGALSGSGGTTGTGTVYIEGDLRPGSSPAAVNFGGDVVVDALATVEIELGGVAPGEFDALQITGEASLDGVLDVTLIDVGGGPFAPDKGDSFEVVTAVDGLSGTFSDELLPTLSTGLVWEVNYRNNSLLLSVFAPDFSGNGIVDSEDLAVWEAGYGVNDLADADGDGDSDGRDFLVWQRHLGGMVSPIANSEAVPEPTSVVLLVILAAFGKFFLRRQCAV